MLPASHKFKKLRFMRTGKRKYLYSAKAYKNPFFQNKKRSLFGQGELKNKNKLIIFTFAVIGLIMVWLLFFSTLFKIQKIEVAGVQNNLASEIELIAKDLAENRLIGKNNLLLYNKSELSKILNEKYYLDSLSVKRKLLHTLTINLREKQQVAIWREEEQYYYLDSDGNIINQLDSLNINGSSYPLIENLTAIKIDGRKANISRETIEYILNLFNEFKDNKHNFKIERFIIDRDVNTVKMAVLAGPKIYYNIKMSAAEQTAKLDLIIKNKLKDEFKNKTYLDLRYANNVYIK